MKIIEVTEETLQKADNATPIYRPQLMRLPPNERIALLGLFECNDGATTEDIAAEANQMGISETSVYLSRLERRGHVTKSSIGDGKRRWTLVDPFFRIYHLCRVDQYKLIEDKK